MPPAHPRARTDARCARHRHGPRTVRMHPRVRGDRLRRSCARDSRLRRCGRPPWTARQCRHADARARARRCGYLSASPQIQQVARDDRAMDLARPFDDPVDANQPVDVFERQLLADAHAAEQLDRTVDDASDHLGGHDLDHRGFAPDVASAIDARGEAPGEHAHRLDLLPGVGDPPLHALSFGQRLAERDAQASPARSSCRGSAAPVPRNARRSRRAGCSAAAAAARTRGRSRPAPGRR